MKAMQLEFVERTLTRMGFYRAAQKRRPVRIGIWYSDEGRLRHATASGHRTRNGVRFNRFIRLLMRLREPL